MVSVPKSCPKCKGSGVLIVLFEFEDDEERIAGFDFRLPLPECRHCDGVGFVKRKKTYPDGKSK